MFRGTLSLCLNDMQVQALCNSTQVVMLYGISWGNIGVKVHVQVSRVPVSVSFFIFWPTNSSSEDTVIVPTSVGEHVDVSALMSRLKTGQLVDNLKTKNTFWTMRKRRKRKKKKKKN